MAEGIRIRHSRRCRSAAGERCNCKPSFEASVYSRRDGAKIRRTFAAEGEAKAWRHDAVGEVRRGKMKAPTRVTLRDAWEAWNEGAKTGLVRTKSGDLYKPSALRGYGQAMRDRVLPAYRAMHAYPLTKVTNGVRHYIRAETNDDSIRPGQRFKRMDRILDKLMRYPKMRLSQMEDIGGCRAVLPNLEQVYGVAERMKNRWRHARVIDYIADPKDTGYRALHLVERRDGRLIEVQLRTPGQHRWAEAVETWVRPAVPFDLKDGAGPAHVKRYFRVAAEQIALVDSTGSPDDRLTMELRELEGRIAPYLRR